MDNINFSIPVMLFDYRESENPLYSYAKLKIFYVGLTGDKRLFTKNFSDKLLATLPYVPVVGYYDEEEDDFKGHNASVQYIYGIVPEDTAMDYIEEDGKQYAVCDVLLYTGRGDKTGEIAKKIVGKQHSLELNPADTKYVVNKDPRGRTQSVEFTDGSLLGLSVLGDNEKPAFSGSGFFTEESEFKQMFQGFKAQLEIFANKNKTRGEEMSVNAEAAAAAEAAELLKAEEAATLLAAHEAAEAEEAARLLAAEEADQVLKAQEAADLLAAEEAAAAAALRHTEGAKLASAFMKETNDETMRDISKAVNSEFGDYTYIVQWSPTENVLVYMDYSAELTYYRVNFTKDEEGAVTFDEKVIVKPRFLTEEEIDSTFAAKPEKEEPVTTELGTEGSDNEGDNFNEQKTEEPKETKTEEELSAIAFTNSEREELEAFRKGRKEALIESFKEELGEEFTTALDVDGQTFEELEVVLSKEFTRVARLHSTKKPTTFIYNGTPNGSGAQETEAQMAARLVTEYKD